MDKYIRKILEASVYEVAQETPLESAPQLSKRLGCQVLLKREDLQSIFSFKIRGAYNKMRSLSEAARSRGVVTASAGNHAQGVATAARKLGIKAYIVMGENTPSIKVAAVRELGANVILSGDSYDEAATHARMLEEEKGYTYIHPFDDPDVIAGQGTIGMEILRQHTGRLDAVFVPVGGGGLIAGVATYIKYLKPGTRVIGVECEGSACMYASLQKGRRVTLRAEDLDQFADGTAVRQVGKEPFRLARKYVDEIIVVSIDEICAAIKDLFEETRTIAEPSGALAIAGMKKYASQGETLCAIVSGANVNFDRLRHISERTEIGEKHEVLLGVTIEEKRGSFLKFCAAIGKRNITEFNYRYTDVGEAHVLVGVQTRTDQDKRALLSKLSSQYQILDLSDNEVAILHVRHMVGGIGNVSDERLFRVEFPEKPGALHRFLSTLGNDFNISMFHYRNHGSAWGRVLVGIQIPDSDMGRFTAKLGDINYRFWNETDNLAYRRFFRS